MRKTNNASSKSDLYATIMPYPSLFANLSMVTHASPKIERIPHLIHLLRQAHPDAHCALNYETPLQLLIATILSAQCTDVRVNLVTPELFAKYPNATAFAEAERAELEETVRSTGFYRQKARFIQETCHLLLTEQGGEVPDNMQSLIQLSGVARKTANVVLGEIFGKSEGIVVDTHVKRLAHRLGLTTETSPVKVERDLMALLPRSEWIDISHLLIFHGRRVCSARRPQCASCSLSGLCPAYLSLAKL